MCFVPFCVTFCLSLLKLIDLTMWPFISGNPNRLLIRGIISIGIGAVIVAVPDLTLPLVIQGLGALMFIDGLVALLINYFSKTKRQSVFLIIPRGTTNLIFGTILLLFPALMVNLFVFLIGFILIFAGFTQFASQLSGRSSLGASWIIIVISIFAMGAGILFITKPFESAETMLTIFGIMIALYGLGEIIWSFKLRKYKKQHPDPVSPSTTIDTDYEEIE